MKRSTMIATRHLVSLSAFGLLLPNALAAPPSVKLMGIRWARNTTNVCQDSTLSNGEICLVRSQKDRILWVIKNDCGDAEFQFTLKDKEPVTNCKITPPAAAAFTIETRFQIKSGQAALVECVVHDAAVIKECGLPHASKYVYHLELVGGGEERPGTHRDGDIRKRSHELDLGVNP